MLNFEGADADPSPRNRQPNPYSGREGDATFPDYIVLNSVAYRF